MILGFRSSKKTVEPTHVEVPHGDTIFKVAVKRNATARKFTLRVVAATGEVVLTLPKRSDLRLATDFAHRHGGWIAARLQKMADFVPCLPGATIPLRDEPHRIVHRPTARGTVWTEQNEVGDRLLIVAGREEHSHRRVLEYLKREAKRDLEAAVLRHTAALGVDARKISLKDTRSRWGSCSSAGRINFSWRLIFAPPFVLDYLAAHEVAHLKEMNHSARFWALTASLCPETDRAEQWLKRHGTGLHRFR